ncbi:hypothetical protein [Cerasicoccus fimbriatus]|uniref:hypothetical protein n=1 Tax=Cerasicoccus fimbriatus TaxID=3014554 RepID=UPI0022B3D2CE|nr:hypothetical protein [Cerasicoccus sp. TK19100]
MPTPTPFLNRLFRAISLGSAAAGLLAANIAHAELSVAEIFSSKMVLQRDKDVPVWGWADAGESVKVSFGGQTATAQANADGKWMAKLSPMDANAKGQTMTVETAGGEKTEFTDVLVGEVWLASGQSNMVAGGPDKPTGVYPHYQSPDTATAPMRFRTFGFGTNQEPVERFPAVYSQDEDREWKDLEFGDESAIPQFFARVVRDGINVPVGMIRVAFPGTNQTAWMSKETLEQFDGEGGNYYLDYKSKKDKDLAEKPKKTKDGTTISSYEEFTEYQKQWIDDPKGKGRYPGGGLREMDFVNWPTTLYNTRIHPLAPFAMRGVIWHQGEGGPRGGYDERLIAMFKQWRELFGQDFYVIWGTLSRDNRQSPPLDPVRSSFYRSWTNNELRDAINIADDKMEYVEFYDLGHWNTHWIQKAESGRRMGLAALDLAYNQSHIYTGPRMADIKADGGTVYVKFSHVGERLIYEPSINGVSGVILIDANKEPRWGNVEVINTDTIKVSHPDITDVAVIAYGEASNPLETLFNSAGLPASPFSKAFKDLGRFKESSDAPDIVKLMEKAKVNLGIGHVRRDGYSFDVTGKKTPDVQVQAYIPAEWTNVAVQTQGEPVPFETVDIEGQKFALFTVKTNGTPYAVTTKESAAKFAPIHRY